MAGPETGPGFLAKTAYLARQRLTFPLRPAPKPRKVKDYSPGARKPDSRRTAWWSWQDSNLQPNGYELALWSDHLPLDVHRRIIAALVVGVAPAIAGGRDHALRVVDFSVLRGGSNRRPPNVSAYGRTPTGWLGSSSWKRYVLFCEQGARSVARTVGAMNAKQPTTPADQAANYEPSLPRSSTAPFKGLLAIKSCPAKQPPGAWASASRSKSNGCQQFFMASDGTMVELIAEVLTQCLRIDFEHLGNPVLLPTRENQNFDPSQMFWLRSESRTAHLRPSSNGKNNPRSLLAEAHLAK